MSLDLGPGRHDHESVRHQLQHALALAALLAASAVPCRAGVTLVAGDIVLVDSFVYASASPGVWRLDPASLDTTLVSAGGLLVIPDRVAVDRSGIIHVADQVSGVVSIDPGTGHESVLVSPSTLGGRSARGICLAPDGTLRVTTAGSNVGAVLSVDPGTGEVEVVSQGGLLSIPACVTAGPDGALYVGDLSANSGTGSSGSIVRIEASGAQSVLANGVPFHGPFDIAISSDGWIWSAQWGWTSRRNGGFVRTRLADGFSEFFPSDRSQGVVTTADGDVLLGDCTSVGLDCYSFYRFIHRPSNGLRRDLPAGAMALVPTLTTPVRRATWGTLKTLYR